MKVGSLICIKTERCGRWNSYLLPYWARKYEREAVYLIILSTKIKQRFAGSNYIWKVICPDGTIKEIERKHRRHFEEVKDV